MKLNLSSNLDESYLLNKMKKWNKLSDLEMDLSRNEIKDEYYAELMNILNELESLTKWNLVLANNKVKNDEFDLILSNWR